MAAAVRVPATSTAANAAPARAARRRQGRAGHGSVRMRKALSVAVQGAARSARPLPAASRLEVRLVEVLETQETTRSLVALIFTGKIAPPRLSPSVTSRDGVRI
jgi:hypothetical protein